MRKGIIVAVATLAMGLTGLFATPAKALQFGFNAGYTSVGFQLHGMGGEFLFGFQGPQGEDDRRPKGSVLRIGLASAAGTGETDLTKAKWNGYSYGDFPLAIATGTAIQAAGGQAAFSQFPQAQQEAILAGAAASVPAVQAGIAQGLGAYGITDATKAKGSATAFFVSAAYEYVLPQGAPGLGFIVGGELYVSQGGYAGNPGFPSVSTEGGIGGGAVVGVSYYLKNGFNMTVKTGLGVVDPGTVTYAFPTGQAPPNHIFPIAVELEAVFYASPTFALGFIY